MARLPIMGRRFGGLTLTHTYGSGLRRITALCLPCILLLGMCARTSSLLACYVGRSSMKTCSASVCMFVLSQIIIVVNIIISQQNLGKSHVMVPEGVDCVKSCRITDTDCISLPTVPSIIPEVSAPSFANTAASQTERAYISSGPLFMGWGGGWRGPDPLKVCRRVRVC